MIIVTLIPLLIFFAILYLRFNKGKIAEKMVHHKLMQLPEEYHVIDNVLFMSMVGQHKLIILWYHPMPCL